jgi:hypothetical protein
MTAFYILSLVAAAILMARFEYRKFGDTDGGDIGFAGALAAIPLLNAAVVVVLATQEVSLAIAAARRRRRS